MYTTFKVINNIINTYIAIHANLSTILITENYYEHVHEKQLELFTYQYGAFADQELTQWYSDLEACFDGQDLTLYQRFVIKAYHWSNLEETTELLIGLDSSHLIKFHQELPWDRAIMQSHICTLDQYQHWVRRRFDVAKKIHMRIASPPVKFPCFYGIDTPNKNELLASKYTIEEVAKYIGVDSLKFISLNGVYKALGHKSGRDNKDPAYTDHYFSGDYPVELVDQNSGTLSSQLSLLIESK